MSEFNGSELEFWLGTWDVTWGEHGHGTNRIERILGDHVIHEQFDGGGETSRLVGQSWSVFDPERHLWRQTWVDDQGGYLDLVGGLVDGWFSFGREAPEDSASVRQRMVFRDVGADGFHWIWEASADDGATWESRWEIDYRSA
ncbi:MAG TPA: hypothetical protein VGQ85_08860 [Candidatus Limnocylindrales bacterium]|nr:hypothetical protein [Candidatus Limnocylindrales bacterium]